MNVGGSKVYWPARRAWVFEVTAPAPQMFRDAVIDTLRDGEVAARFKQAATDALLEPWTTALTEVVVRSCEALGLSASGKGHKLDLLPVGRSEYLGLDVTAFSEGQGRWRFAALVAELENSRREDLIAYSLWKVLSVRAGLRVVFCYREKSESVPTLLRHLRQEVVEAMGVVGRSALDGDTMVVCGTRDAVNTFPHGYFAWWELNKNTGSFERV
jgi:hypothetical protein